ncbi:MAG: hypothetical protein KAF40_04295, partial [Flavihumibacter sp.]|nr:hypothetical protein [Flavihumibacter sp.]
MDINKPLTIAYGGSLDSYEPRHESKLTRSILQWFWTFRNTTVDSSTRSGYYFIKAVALLQTKYGVKPSQLQVQWWGLIDSKNQEQVNRSGVSDFFHIEGYLSKASSLQKLSQADCLFLPLEKSTSTDHGPLFIPGKLFDYLKVGKPILALCDESDCKAIIEQSGLGIFAKPDDPEMIAAALIQYRSEE